MKSIVIHDKETGKTVKVIEISDETAKTIHDIGGINVANFFSWEIK